MQLPVTILDIIKMVLEIALGLYKERTDPEQAKIRAAATITAQLSDNHDELRKSIVANDPVAIAAHFEQMRDRSLELVGDKLPGLAGAMKKEDA